MKKRIFCLILALVMVLSLAACAGSGNDNTENTKDTTADTTNTDGSENNGGATTPVSGGEAELALFAKLVPSTLFPPNDRLYRFSAVWTRLRSEKNF